jgi:hypothetical protein
MSVTERGSSLVISDLQKSRVTNHPRSVVLNGRRRSLITFGGTGLSQWSPV